jgi:hypothetical protein
VAKYWGRLTNSDQKYFDGRIKFKIMGDSHIIPMRLTLQDKAHYDLLIKEAPPNSTMRYPLIMVYDLLPFFNFVFSTENTIVRTNGDAMPESTKTGFAKFPDMKRRTDKAYSCQSDGSIVLDTTPTSGRQWLKGKIKNPVTGKTSPNEIWLNFNTQERRCVIVDRFAKQVSLTYPSLGDDGRADAKCSFIYTETTINGQPSPVEIANKTMQIRSYKEDFARGGDPRNLIGGSPVKDTWRVTCWCDANQTIRHWGLSPR